jgi:hypothetical protein
VRTAGESVGERVFQKGLIDTRGWRRRPRESSWPGPRLPCHFRSLKIKKLTTRNRAPKLGARFFPSSRSARDWKYFSIPFRGRPSPSIGRTGKAFSGTHRPLCWTKPVERLDGYAARGVGGIGVDLMRPLRVAVPDQRLRVAVPDQRRTAPLRFALHRIQDTWLS